MGIVEEFSQNPQVQDIRLVTGSVTAVQFPNVPLLMVRFKAQASNVGSFLLGETANDLYWEMRAGDDTGWVAMERLDHLWYKNLSGTSDYLAYWIQR